MPSLWSLKSVHENAENHQFVKLLTFQISNQCTKFLDEPGRLISQATPDTKYQHFCVEPALFVYMLPFKPKLVWCMVDSCFWPFSHFACRSRTSTRVMKIFRIISHFFVIILKRPLNFDVNNTRLEHQVGSSG